MRASVVQPSLALLATLLAAPLAGCGADALEPAGTGRLAISAAASEPLHRGTNAFVVEVRDAAGARAAVDGAYLDVTSTMPAMGHGSPVTPKVHALGGGRYRVEEVVFNMPGTWEVRYRVTAGEVYDAAAFRYEVP